MLKKILFAVPLMTILWLAPGAILAAEPAISEPAAVGAAETAEKGAALPGDAASQAVASSAGETAVQTKEAAAQATDAGETAGQAADAGKAANQAEQSSGPEEAGPSGSSKPQPGVAAAAENGGSAVEGQEDGAVEGQEDGAAEALLAQPSYTEEDLYVMAHVLAGECQNCPDEEQLYVGSVVLNRKAHPSFPGTVRGVVFQKGQYSCTRDGNYYREPTERNWANARKLLEEGSVLPGNVVWQSGKKQGRGVYVRTKWHYYCY